MTIEDKLKEFILTRYNSIREFTQAADIPYTTMDSIFRRGVENSAVSNIIKICKALNISADALAEGDIVPRNIPKESIPSTDVRDIVNDTKAKLFQSTLTINGKPVDVETVEPIIDALNIGYKMVERANSKVIHKQKP